MEIEVRLVASCDCEKNPVFIATINSDIRYTTYPHSYTSIVHDSMIVHDGPNMCKCDPTISNPDSSNFGLSSPHI